MQPQRNIFNLRARSADSPGNARRHYANYLLEKIPASDRPAHLAWYSLILNAAVLIGSLAGPALASHIGLSTALILFAVLRLLSGLVILKWG